MTPFNHPNLVKLYGGCWNEGPDKLCLVLEFCPKGSLRTLMDGTKDVRDLIIDSIIATVQKPGSVPPEDVPELTEPLRRGPAQNIVARWQICARSGCRRPHHSATNGGRAWR